MLLLLCFSPMSFLNEAEAAFFSLAHSLLILLLDAFKDFFMSAANNLKSYHITYFSLCHFPSFSLSFLSCCNSCSRYVCECHSFAAYMNTALHVVILLLFLCFSYIKKLTIERKAYLKRRKVSHIISLSAVIMNVWTLEEKLLIQ